MKVYELLDRPGAWCQRGAAKLADGTVTYPGHLAAVSWCLVGALCRCYPADGHYEDYVAARRRLLDASLGETESLVGWNNAPERTQEEVVAACRRADV